MLDRHQRQRSCFGEGAGENKPRDKAQHRSNRIDEQYMGIGKHDGTRQNPRVHGFKKRFVALEEKGAKNEFLGQSRKHRVEKQQEQQKLRLFFNDIKKSLRIVIIGEGQHQQTANQPSYNNGPHIFPCHSLPFPESLQLGEMIMPIDGPTHRPRRPQEQKHIGRQLENDDNRRQDNA